MMTDDAKFFVRPKVRFCQTDTCEPIVEQLKRSTDQNVRQSNKPKIRSIVTLDKPVKLLKFNKTHDVHDDHDAQIIDNTQKNESTVCINAPHICTDNDNRVETENQKPLNDNRNIKNIQTNSKDTELKIRNTPAHNKTPFLPNKVLKSQNQIKTNATKSHAKGKKGKENEINKNIVKKLSDLKVTDQKTKPSSLGTNLKKADHISKASVASKKNLSTKSNVMPCHKHAKAALKLKTSPVKKTVIRDVIGPKIKPYVGPGVLRKKQSSSKAPEIGKGTSVTPSISGEQLARPEYNSIMCTINKLNEMKRQKIVTDVEHLPPSYKHLINGKISTALDFPLDEAIYKNLVDLSIDENQLPGRLIRSKDPEPRLKDVAPILSDFFLPVSTEEYCTSVSVKPRPPETTEIWNAFAISEKIFEWNRILDRV